jgi:hypothetical protein
MSTDRDHDDHHHDRDEHEHDHEGHDHEGHDHEGHDHEGHDHDHDHHQRGDDCDCHRPPDCPDCDPDLIDDLKCQAEGIAAQAAYNAASQPELQTASADYATARSAYRTARAEARPEVQDLRHQVKQLVERIRCQIKQDRVVECLDRAYRHICRQLEKCGDAGGCCSTEDCDFDKTCPAGYDELVSRIAEYQAHLERDQACFTALVGEPAALTARVTAVKAEIGAVNADLGGDPATIDLKKVYVASLVAQRHLTMVWNGFTHTKDYLDCLCRALTCWTKASDAVSILTGCKAVKDCRKAARRKHCEDLATKTVEEILMEYERLCGTEPCEKPDDSDDCDDQDHDGDDHDHHDDHDKDEECGCNHGHSHQRSHHHHSHKHDSGAS